MNESSATHEQQGSGITADLADRYWRRSGVIASALEPLAATGHDDAEFRLLVDNLPILCWLARGDGYIVWYNRRWHEYCGTTPADMEGWKWQSVHDPEALPHVLAGWHGSVATGAPFEMTFPLRGADGQFRPFLTRVSPLRDASGAVVRWFGVNIDIREQRQAEAARDASEATYRVLTEAMPQMVWSTRPDGYHDFFNAQWYKFTGVPARSTEGAAWAGLFHPDDQDLAWARWRHSLATGDPYEVEYRLRHQSGEYRWTLGRALPVRDERGAIMRWIGTCTDIHDAKQAAAQNDLLNQELSHRIKNIFAIIGGLIRLSARREPGVKSYAHNLLERIAALGRAHDFARPHSAVSRPLMAGRTLLSLLHELFRPYADGEVARIVVTGDDVPIDDKGATPIALLFHELATNAAKYGALSEADGQIAVDVAHRGDLLTITWRERGGPAVPGEPDQDGFGTKLAAMSVDQQLGGSLARHWHAAGLEAIVTIQPSRLVRS